MCSESARPRRVDLEVSTVVGAPPEVVFDAATDWPAQREWVALTTVAVIGGDGRSVGSRIEAVTGPRRGGLRDVFEVTGWDRPSRVEILHVGRVVRGPASFVFVPLGQGRTRFVWSESLDLPLGALGRVGWPVVRPAFVLGLRTSLRSFARYVERGSGV